MAPEILCAAGHGCPVDWWALGVLLFEMLVGNTPFADEDEPSGESTRLQIIDAVAKCFTMVGAARNERGSGETPAEDNPFIGTYCNILAYAGEGDHARPPLPGMWGASSLDRDASGLICALMAVDPAKRPPPAEVMRSHKFVNAVDFVGLERHAIAAPHVPTGSKKERQGSDGNISIADSIWLSDEDRDQGSDNESDAESDRARPQHQATSTDKGRLRAQAFATLPGFVSVADLEKNDNAS
jgi:serine/threonine protein kinase